VTLLDTPPTNHEDQAALLDTVDRLVREHIEPRAAAIDAANEFPQDIYDLMAQIGLFGLWIPEQYGGVGTGLETNVKVVERIARASAACALIFASCGDASAPILQNGSEEIKDKYLPRIATGELVPCFALTEPQAGSDAASITTRAVRDGDCYRITGHKVFCTNGSVGGIYTVCASTDPTAGGRGISAFLVPRETDGLTITRDEDLIGLRGCPNSEIVLEDATVDASALLGEEGKGLRVALMSLDHARLHAAASSLGIARGATELAITYARERVQFGRPIIEHQGLQFLLADMSTDLAAGWALLERAVGKVEGGASKEASIYAAMTKLFCTDVGMRRTVDAVQVFGGSGLSKSLPVERMMRDAKAYQIFDGTNQIQRMIIGRYLAQSFITY
jgi:alkylation response protein AidB-like acyl-CoA dehydrogenase